MIVTNYNFRPPQNGDSGVYGDDDDAGFEEYRSRSRQSTLTRSPPTSPNGNAISPKDRPSSYPTHPQKSRRQNPEFDNPKYTEPIHHQRLPDHSSMSSLGSRDQRPPSEDGYGSRSDSDLRRRPDSDTHRRHKEPSPAKRKLYEDFSSPDEGGGSGYDPALDPFSDENFSPDADQFGQDSVDSYATPSDDDVFPKKKIQSSHHDPRRRPEMEKMQRTAAPQDHAGYKPGRDIDRRPQGPKNDYEDMTGKKSYQLLIHLL